MRVSIKPPEGRGDPVTSSPEPVSLDAFAIVLPARLYDALVERGAFQGSAAEDRSANSAMNGAVRKPRGRGYQYRMVGGRKALEYILGYIGDLPEVIGSTNLTASEYSSQRRIMERVARQKLEAVRIPIRKEAVSGPPGEGWKEVHHSGTGALVGWLGHGRFVSVEE